MGTRVVSGVKKRAVTVNGIFYPENPETLAEMLVSWDLKTGSASGGRVLVAPHGAWDFTGNLAASAFAAAQKKDGQTGKKINRVLLLGSCHDSNEEGIFLSESSSFEALCGDLPVDQKLNLLLASCSTLIQINDIPHLCEHSLEILLPFVKHCFPDVKIIPILMCGKRPVLISCLAKALRVTFEKYMDESLIVVSSNVSRNHDKALALSMADEFQSILKAMDTKSFLSGLAANRINACGAALLGAVLESGLVDGKSFSSLCPLVKGKGEDGETVYYGAFAT